MGRCFVVRIDMLQAVGQRDAPVFELKGEQAVVYKDIGVGNDIQAGVQAALEICGEFQHAVLVAQNNIQPAVCLSAAWGGTSVSFMAASSFFWAESAFSH